MVQSSDGLNINQNPLYTEINMLELILSGKKVKVSFNPVIKIKANVEKPKNIMDLMKVRPTRYKIY